MRIKIKELARQVGMSKEYEKYATRHSGCSIEEMFSPEKMQQVKEDSDMLIKKIVTRAYGKKAYEKIKKRMKTSTSMEMETGRQ